MVGAPITSPCHQRQSQRALRRIRQRLHLRHVKPLAQESDEQARTVDDNDFCSNGHSFLRFPSGTVCRR